MSKFLPRKRFGQHFLINHLVIDQIVQSLNLTSEQTLIEIGPGTGILTEKLLGVKKLDAIEIDRDLIKILNSKFGSFKNFNLHNADVLKFKFPDSEPYTVVGNLPYNVATAIIIKLLSANLPITSMYFMVQEEVGLRLAAKPGTKSYGRLALFTQYFCDVVPLFSIEPNSFAPPPKVRSMFLCLIPKVPITKVKNFKLFESLIKSAFMQRRKIIKNVWKQFFSIDELERLSISCNERAENLNLGTFIAASNYLTAKNNNG